MEGRRAQCSFLQLLLSFSVDCREASLKVRGDSRACAWSVAVWNRRESDWIPYQKTLSGSGSGSDEKTFSILSTPFPVILCRPRINEEAFALSQASEIELMKEMQKISVDASCVKSSPRRWVCCVGTVSVLYLDVVRRDER